MAQGNTFLNPDAKVFKCREGYYKSQFVDLDDDPKDMKCLLCDETFLLPILEKDFLSHLFQKHKLVIGDVWQIASLKSYVRYWRVKLLEEPLEKFCTTLLMDSTPYGAPSQNEPYFLLSDCLQEDKILRDELHQAKLEWVLAEQERERNDASFKRGCMFCRMEFCGSRIEYLKHLSQKHNILLGKPENLVYIDEFLDKIQHKIESFICIYCERHYKDRLVLKEHMRKKLHKQVNPKNKSYDKYYITNYLEINKKGKTNPKFDYSETEDPTGFSSEDEDWSDWNNEFVNIHCLFCSHKTQDFPLLLDHMRIEHLFDFEETTKGLTYYQKIKLVNYIRRQVQLKHCVFCNQELPDTLDEHMREENHCKIPSEEIWDQAEYYFPSNESDSFLFSLDTSSEEETEIAETSV